MKIGPYEVLRSNAGYYVGRMCTEGPYDRRSGYFVERAGAEAELCSYNGHSENADGFCIECGKIINLREFQHSMILKTKPAEVKKLFGKIRTKDDWSKVAKFLGIPDHNKSKKNRMEFILTRLWEPWAL